MEIASTAPMIDAVTSRQARQSVWRLSARRPFLVAMVVVSALYVVELAADLFGWNFPGIVLEPVRDIRIALILFAVVGLTFERYTHRAIATQITAEVSALVTNAESTVTERVRELVEAARLDAAKKILQNVVGDAGYQAITPYIEQKVTLWRPAAMLTVRIHKIDDDSLSNHCFVELSFQATVNKSNDGADSELYSIGTREDRTYHGNEKLATTIEKLTWNKVDQQVNIDEEALRIGVMSASCDVALAPGNTGFAYLAWRVGRYIDDHYDFCMWRHTGQLRIMVHHAPDIAVDVEGVGASNVKLTSIGAAASEDIWTVDDMLLPSQGITVKWKRRSAEGATTQQ